MIKNDDKQQDDTKLVDDPQIEDEQDLDNEELIKIQEELEQVKETAAQMENQLKRAVADYHNLEKRVSEGKVEFANWATAELVKKLLPVMNNFDQVVKGVGEDEKKSAWFKGVELSVKQLQDILRSEGLDEIRADGQFDPALHEAVDTRDGEHDKIVEVTEKGYTLDGKVIKPAKVVVGRKG